MNKNDVIAFFDGIAADWDQAQPDRTDVINKIFDHAQIGPDQDILDVACGTGILFPYYMQRQVRSVTGIDISPQMAKLAAEKHKNIESIQVLCGDIEKTSFDRTFDQVMVYNAFPHFPDPQALIATLAGLLKEGGRLTVAHGASREQIDDHHKGAASKVSNGLMHAEQLRQLLLPYFDVDVMISGKQMYQVSGTKRSGTVHMHSHGGYYHSHNHDHDHRHSPSDTPLDELVALLKYMTDHNAAHAEELANLAQQLEDAGNRSACRKIMDAVVNFDVGNATLAAVLDDLTQKEDE